MKIIFQYYSPFGELIPNCGGMYSLYNSNVIATYVSTLNNHSLIHCVLSYLKNSEITWEYIGTDAFDAYIDYDMVKIGFDLLDGYDKDDEINDEVDHSEYLIKRKELIYLLEKWSEFIQKPITDSNYQEIIDLDDSTK